MTLTMKESIVLYELIGQLGNSACIFDELYDEIKEYLKKLGLSYHDTDNVIETYDGGLGINKATLNKVLTKASQPATMS